MSCYPLRVFVDDECEELALRNNDSLDNVISLCGTGNYPNCQLLTLREQLDCAAELDCIMDCISTDCSSRTINATLATSLDIDCANSSLLWLDHSLSDHSGRLLLGALRCGIL